MIIVSINHELHKKQVCEAEESFLQQTKEAEKKREVNLIENRLRNLQYNSMF